MVSVEDLSFRYVGQDAQALDGIGFQTEAGTVTLISGPTGCGKSTLAMILCGAIPHLLKGSLSGRASVNGKDPGKTPVREMARTVGLLMQNVEWQVFTDNVCDEVAFGLENFGLPADEMPARIDEALEAAGAGHLKGRALDTLSAGERQRAVIASLLALGQKVLILDEPLAYLDRTGAGGLLASARDLARRGTTVLLIEHRRDAAMTVADRELYMEEGRLSAGPSDFGELSRAARPEFPLFAEPAASGPPVLELEDVHFAWGDEPFLRKVSFDVKAGESVVLLGDNGSGKTTLLRLAMGLLRPASGRMGNCGLDATRTSTKRLAEEAALVLQNPEHQLYLPTVEQEVSGGMDDEESARREIDFLGLRGLEGRHPHSLSTGQKRRVTLASALARRPKLLMLDEPTVGQDDASLHLVLERLERFVREGGALLCATHDARAATCLAHRTVLLEAGGSRIGSDAAAALREYFEPGDMPDREGAANAPARRGATAREGTKEAPLSAASTRGGEHG